MDTIADDNHPLSCNLEDKNSPPVGLKWLSWYIYPSKKFSSGAPLDAAHVTLPMLNLSAAVASRNRTLARLANSTWNKTAMKENIGRRRDGRPELSVLASTWSYDPGVTVLVVMWCACVLRVYM